MNKIIGVAIYTHKDFVNQGIQNLQQNPELIITVETNPPNLWSAFNKKIDEFEKR